MLIRYGINQLSLNIFLNQQDVNELIKCIQHEYTPIDCIFYNHQQYFKITFLLEIATSNESIILTKNALSLQIDAETKAYMLYLLEYYLEKKYFPVSECCEELNLKTGKNVQIYFQDMVHFNI